MPGEATIPMPEVLAKLIKSDAEATHRRRHRQEHLAPHQHAKRANNRAVGSHSAPAESASAAAAGSWPTRGGRSVAGAPDANSNEFPPGSFAATRSSSSLPLSVSLPRHPAQRRPTLGMTAGGKVGPSAEYSSAKREGAVADLWEDHQNERGPRAGVRSGSAGIGMRGERRRERLSDELVLPHWAPEVAEMARHRVEAGDVFHAVAICEVVR